MDICFRASASKIEFPLPVTAPYHNMADFCQTYQYEKKSMNFFIFYRISQNHPMHAQISKPNTEIAGWHARNSQMNELTEACDLF